MSESAQDVNSKPLPHNANAGPPTDSSGSMPTLLTVMTGQEEAAPTATATTSGDATLSASLNTPNPALSATLHTPNPALSASLHTPNPAPTPAGQPDSQYTNLTTVPATQPSSTSAPAATPAPTQTPTAPPAPRAATSAPLPACQVGRLAQPTESCFVCGHRWATSLRYRLTREVYMFSLPRRAAAKREWLLALNWSRASAPPADGRLCSLHFGPTDCRPVPADRSRAQLLPIAMPRRRYCDQPPADHSRRCSYPLCRGQRRQLLSVLAQVQEEGSAPLRRAARPYWSRQRYPLPEPGPVNQAWVDLFTEALNDRPNVPDEVELSFLCPLHFAPKWFRWENRGRPRVTSEPLGDPRLDKYAEPTLFSSSALVGGLRLALEKDLRHQQLSAEREAAEKQAAESGATAEGKTGGEDDAEMRCGYPFCASDASPVLFAVPTAEEPERRQLWMRSLQTVVSALGREAALFEPEKCTMLCANHFREENVTRMETDGQIIISLDPRAVPVRFRRPAPGAAAAAAKRAHLRDPVVSWPDELGRLVETAALQLTETGAESSEEERDEAEEAASAAMEQARENSVPDGVPQVELHIKMEPVPEEPSPFRRGRGRGRGRGRARGRGRGQPRLSSPLPSPSPPASPAPSPSPAPAPSTPPPRRPVGRPPAAGTAAQRQLRQVIRAASHGHFGSFRALDHLLSADTEERPARSSADQLLRMCLMLRLKQGAYVSREVEVVGEQGAPAAGAQEVPMVEVHDADVVEAA